jgi:2',3'-cyclic-nucleotide 2'-phosphodiesterase (5'-nucleotidase family)
MEMDKAKLVVLSLLGLLAACAPKQPGPGMVWKRVAMDGSRTGVVAVNAENVDTALGTFEDDYIAPDGRHFTDGATPEVAAMLMDVQPKMARLKEVVAHSARVMENIRTEPDLPLGNLVADALRAKGSDYFGKPMDFSIINYGGIRIPMPEGAVILDDIEAMFPFKNYMCYAAVKGKNLTRLLEQLAKTQAFQAVSGCRVKVKAHELVEAEVGGEPIDPERTYNVATIDFLLSGGDQIAIGALAEDVILSPVLVREVMLEYVKGLEAQGKVIDIQKDGRVIMED